MPARLRAAPRRLLSPDFLIPAALFLFAFALRLYGVRGSLPYIGHTDEPKLVDSATHIVKSGDLNPRLYIWPSLYVYLEALVVRAHEIWGTLRGYYRGAQSLPDITHILSLAPGVYVWTRALTAAVGALTVSLLYAVGREMFNGSRRVGVVAALMLAVSPLHVEYSHFALTDVPLGLAGLLALWSSYRLSRMRESGSSLVWTSALCGLLVGIATATKYNGVYLGVVPVTAWLMQWLRRRREAAAGGKGGRASRQLWALAAIPLGALVGFILCEPYALLDWPSFYNGFTFQVGAYEPANSLAEVRASIERHLADLRKGNGYFLGPALLGAIVLMFNPPVRNRAWLLIPFPLLYLLAMSRFSLTYVRNLIVTLPFLAIMGGYAVDMAATQVTGMLRGMAASGLPQLSSRHLWGVVRWGAVALAMLLILAEPLRMSANYSRYQADPESRNLAWAWMQQRMRAGDRFAAELHPWQTQDWPDVLAFDVENPDSATPLTTRPPGWYADHGYDYVVLNSNYRDAQRDPALWDTYKKLPVARLFPGDKEGGKGPTITVLSTGGSPQPQVMHTSGAKLEDFATLVGYDLAPLTATNVLLDPATGPGIEEPYKPGQAVGLNVYYRALRDGAATDPNWQVWVHLVDPATGGTVAQVDTAPLTGMLRAYPGVTQQPHPVSQWHQGELLSGVYNFSLPAGMPAGRYRLETGMWVPPNGPGARITDSPTPDRIVLGDVEVDK
jgi:4-amino-4-deoxy-L-arabinose transferase-like glycosyltransferase